MGVRYAVRVTCDECGKRVEHCSQDHFSTSMYVYYQGQLQGAGWEFFNSIFWIRCPDCAARHKVEEKKEG